MCPPFCDSVKCLRCAASVQGQIRLFNSFRRCLQAELVADLRLLCIISQEPLTG